jgi:hemolysin-activating ACP:hemolysin acyltransferase
MRNLEEFAERTARHFAAMRERRAAEPSASESFPDDWFNLSPERYADFGVMFYLASMMPFHRARGLAAAVSTFEPALRLGQYHIFRSGGYPRAFTSWAGLSAAAERRFAVDHLPLAPDEWNGGPSIWLVDFVAPFGHLREIVPKLTENPALRRLRTLWYNEKGDAYRVIEWTRAAAGGRVDERMFSPEDFAAHLAED